LLFFSAAGAGAATTGVATTGATTSGAAVFLETTDFLEATAGELIILVAVEVFMAGIRIVRRLTKSILGATFIFCRGPKLFE
jgi:hypothetical protein